VLEQLQLSKVQLLALQEYPAASLLDNGRVIPPSCASTAAGSKAESNQADRMASRNIVIRKVWTGEWLVFAEGRRPRGLERTSLRVKTDLVQGCAHAKNDDQCCSE